MLKNRWNHILIVALIALLSSCGDYEKILKSGDIDLKYERALEYYEEGQYVKAVTLIEQILPRLKGTQKAEELDYLHARCYYEMDDFVMAGHYYRTFVSNYFNSPRAEEADFMGAYCYYQLSSRPELDQSNTISAINAFTLFMNRWPNSSRVDEARELIFEMEEVLVEKSYMTARLYYDLEKYKSAIVAINNSLQDYPDTKYREELIFLKLKASYLLARNSIRSKQQERYQDTVDEYYTFIDEFPESEYAREAERIYNESTEFLANK
jgi:outer membrane protein assembly factor BamD